MKRSPRRIAVCIPPFLSQTAKQQNALWRYEVLTESATSAPPQILRDVHDLPRSLTIRIWDGFRVICGSQIEMGYLSIESLCSL